MSSKVNCDGKFRVVVESAWERLSADLSRCGQCGFCQARCPVYGATRHESLTARARMALLRNMEAGEEPPDDVRESLSACLLCGACTAD